MQVKVDIMKSITGIREMMNIADDCIFPSCSYL